MKKLLVITFLTLSLIIGAATAEAGFNDYKKVRYKNEEYKEARKEPRYIDNKFGKFYTFLGGPRGVVLCFHEEGGKAEDWMSGARKDYLDFFKKKGYTFICPSAKDGKWSGKDIQKIDELLNELQIKSYRSLYLVGYAEGGDFASQYAASSARAHKVKGIQFSNSAGISSTFDNPNLDYEAYFAYARCDKSVDYREIQKNRDKIRRYSEARDHMLDVTYFSSGDMKCEKFLNLAEDFYSYIK